MPPKAHPITEPRPPAPDAFVGREDELARLRDAMERPGVVTVLGPGGVGKSRLLRERLRRGVPGEGVYCNVAGAGSIEALCRCVAGALGLPMEASADPDALVTQLGRAIANRGLAWVALDTFERHAPEADRTLAAWHELAPGCCFVAASRTRLRLRDERTVPVLPLSIEESCALFVARVAAVAPRHVPAPEDEALVRAIAERLDGLPLAIELAAPRLELLGLPTLARLFDEGLPLLTRPLRGCEDRHRTLTACIEWSLSLLDDEHRAFLTQCAVFEGPFDVEAAAAVVSLPTRPPDAGRATLWALDHVAELVDQSLIQSVPGRERRFVLLDSIRSLLVDEAAEARGRHGRWAVELARTDPERARDEVLAFARRAGTDELGLALTGLVHIEQAYLRRGPLSEYTRELSRVIDAAEAVAAPEVARARVALSVARLLTGDIASGVDASERAWAYARDAGDPDLRALAAAAHLHALLWAQRPDEAAALVADGARDLADAGPRARGRFLMRRAFHHQLRGAQAEGIRDTTEALARFVEAGHRRDEAIAHGDLADMYSEIGEHDAAGRHFEAARHIAEELGDVRQTGFMLLLGAGVEHERSHLAVAAERLEEAEARFRHYGCSYLEAIAQGYLGRLDFERGRYPWARERFASAADGLTPFDHPMVPWLRAAQAAAEAALGEADQARRTLARARAIPCERATEDDRLAVTIYAAIVEGDAAAARELAAPTDGGLDASRIARRLLRRHLAEQSAWRVARDGRWLEGPEGRAEITRQAPRRILAALLAADGPLDGEGLYAAGWPDQPNVKPRSASNRLHNALSTLRSAGLGALLVRGDDGYALDPGVSLCVVDPTG